VDLLKIPESFERTPGEPVCIWRFAFEDLVLASRELKAASM